MAKLPPHVQRMVAERAELGERRDKLAAFVASDKLADLDAQDAALLNSQLRAMGEYYDILDLRLARVGVHTHGMD